MGISAGVLNAAWGSRAFLGGKIDHGFFRSRPTCPLISSSSGRTGILAGRGLRLPAHDHGGKAVFSFPPGKCSENRAFFRGCGFRFAGQITASGALIGGQAFWFL